MHFEISIDFKYSFTFFPKRRKNSYFSDYDGKKTMSWLNNVYWLDFCGVGEIVFPNQCENDGNDFNWAFCQNVLIEWIKWRIRLDVIHIEHAFV